VVGKISGEGEMGSEKPMAKDGLGGLKGEEYLRKTGGVERKKTIPINPKRRNNLGADGKNTFSEDDSAV